MLETVLPKGWTLAVGSCGLSTSSPVYGAYVRGHALFAWQSSPDRWSSCVTGLCSCGGETLAIAAASAEREAHSNADFIARQPNGSWGDADRRLSRKQFNAAVAGEKVSEPRKR